MGALCGKSDKTFDYQGISKKEFVGIKNYSILRDYQIERNLGFGSFGEV